MAGRKPTTSEVRFAEKCKPVESGCIERTGGGNRWGYGLFHADGGMRAAHRWAFEQAHGKQPAGIDICHHCDNRKCVNLQHLFAGTRKENMQDAVRKGRTSRGRPRPSMQGSRHHHAVLDESRVFDIRKRHADGEAMRQLSDEFGVSFQSISRIVRRISWAYV